MRWGLQTIDSGDMVSQRGDSKLPAADTGVKHAFVRAQAILPCKFVTLTYHISTCHNPYTQDKHRCARDANPIDLVSVALG